MVDALQRICGFSKMVERQPLDLLFGVTYNPGVFRISVISGDAVRLTDLKGVPYTGYTGYGLGWIPPTPRCCCAT